MNWVWKLLGYTDEDKKYAKAIIGKYQLEKAKEFYAKKDATRDEAHKIAKEIMNMTAEDVPEKSIRLHVLAGGRLRLWERLRQ